MKFRIKYKKLPLLRRGICIENSYGRLLTITGQTGWGKWWLLHDSGRAKPYTAEFIFNRINEGYWRIISYPVFNGGESERSDG